MTAPEHPIAEEELHSYVDGRLGGERRAVVDRYLQAHPDAAKRAEAYIAQREGLRSAFSARAVEPIPPQLNLSRLIEARLIRRPAPWRAAVAAMLVLGLGGLGGWLVGSRPPSGIDELAQESATSYAVYAADKRHPVEIWAVQRDDLTRWVSSRLNRPVAPPDLSATGYDLLGGRLVASPHGAAALFVYENEQHARLTVYVRPMSAGQTTSIEQLDSGAVDGCVWIEQGVGYSLVATETYQRLVELSQHVRQETRAPG